MEYFNVLKMLSKGRFLLFFTFYKDTLIDALHFFMPQFTTSNLFASGKSLWLNSVVQGHDLFTYEHLIKIAFGKEWELDFHI